MWKVVLLVLVVGICWIGDHEKRPAPSVPVQSVSGHQNYDDGYLAGVLKALKAQEEANEQACR